jgi:ABC-2 type transport system permease protein
MGIVIGGFVLFSPSGNELGLSPWSVTLGLVAAFCAMLLNLLMASIVEMVAFWAENVWTLGVMLMFAVRLLGGALLPLALFPEPWQRALAYSPFPYMISFPILSITGKVTGLEWLKGMGIIGAWVLALSWVYALVWQRGNLRYSGAGQ